MEEPQKPQPPILQLDWQEIDRGLSENQKEALRFIAAGFGNVEASKSIGMHRTIVSKWLRKSIDFLNAYERVIGEVRKYNQAMMEYSTTMAWIRIHQYMAFDPADLIKEVKDKKIPPPLAKTLITEQGRMLRHITGGVRPQTHIVAHDVTPALLRATENAASIVADRMAELKGEEEIIDVEASVAEYRKAIAPPTPKVVEGQITVDWKEQKLQCPVCEEWLSDLTDHCRKVHDMSIKQLRETYNLAPDSPVSFKAALGQRNV